MTMNRVLRAVLMVTLSMALAVGMWGAMPAQRVAAASEDDVIINEFVVNPATGKEYVELLVVAPGGVDMQGWTLSDVNTRAGATGTTEGDVTLPASAAYLSNVPQGTYVVIVFTTPAANANTLTEDVNLTDGNNRLVLIIGTTADLVVGGVIDNSTNENLQLYAGTRATDTLVDQVLCGSNAAYIPGATWGDNSSATTADNVNGGSSIPSGAAVRFVPTENTLAGFRDNDTGARFTVDSSSYGSAGDVNTGVTDSAVTNPSYSSGTVPAGHYTGLTIAGGVSLAGNVSVYKNGLSVNAGGTLDLATYTVSVADGAGTVINNGTLKQTQTVNDETVNFLTISTDKYRGVDIDTSNDLGSVTVAIQGNADACTTNPASPAYIKRCFSITPTNNLAATLTLWATDGEMNGIDYTFDTAALYRYVTNQWVEQEFVEQGTDTNSYNYITANVTGFSGFLMGESGETPTAVALSGLSATSPFAALAVGLLAAAGLVVLRKRK